jgi:hypothetical protein
MFDPYSSTMRPRPHHPHGGQWRKFGKYDDSLFFLINIGDAPRAGLWRNARISGCALRGVILMKPMIFMDAETALGREASAGPQESALRRAVLDRMRGPGGFYNLGNLIGLAAGIALQLSQPSGRGAADAVLNHFAGNASAALLTGATLIFLVSGEAYHRAWANGFPPHRGMNRLGDLLSGFGALALCGALFMLGQPILAATAGFLHAFGKFGSALHQPNPLSKFDWPLIFRAVVIESRVPAIFAAFAELARLLADGAPLMPVCTPVTLLICYVFWTKADFMLLRG